ncbi:STAS domain-containing protein [Polyangium sp. y55x31]|uniref:STAS domain-containing protein n=1 Tax=Polyangium sp. y55x31 TaxID=3042688 RepID=UPI00248323D9|nr:STAS domain-containing protein [Polyangium sp. y55x31]MDI1482032.1 STAS domain-containing protein [Polyangium sp. y55x31]
MTDTTDESVVVEGKRIERVLEALSLASVGAFDEAIGLSGALTEDRFGALEESLLVLLRELKQTREEHDKAMSDLEASRRDLEEQLATVERQRIAIRELSVPIIDVWDDVLTLPLVGAIDSARAAEMTEKLLQRIADRGAEYVIIDLTGVDVVDTMTAAHLVRLTHAAKLLGAKCVLTGVRPDVARTLVEIGVHLGGLMTLRTLKDGLRACLNMREADRISLRKKPGEGDKDKKAQASKDEGQDRAMSRGERRQRPPRPEASSSPSTAPLSLPVSEDVGV